MLNSVLQRRLRYQASRCIMECCHTSIRVTASSKLRGTAALYLPVHGVPVFRAPVPPCSCGTRSKPTGQRSHLGLAVHGMPAFARASGVVIEDVSLQARELRPPQPSGDSPSQQLSSQWGIRFLEQRGGVLQKAPWAPSPAEAGELPPAVLQERAAGIAQALAIARNAARQRRRSVSYDTECLLALEVANCSAAAQ